MKLNLKGKYPSEALKMKRKANHRATKKKPQKSDTFNFKGMSSDVNAGLINFFFIFFLFEMGFYSLIFFL